MIEPRSSINLPEQNSPVFSVLLEDFGQYLDYSVKEADTLWDIAR